MFSGCCFFLAIRIDQADVIFRWRQLGWVRLIIGEFIVVKCFMFYLFTELNLVPKVAKVSMRQLTSFPSSHFRSRARAAWWSAAARRRRGSPCSPAAGTDTAWTPQSGLSSGMSSPTKHNLRSDIYSAVQVWKMSSINATPAYSGIVHREQDWLGVCVWTYWAVLMTREELSSRTRKPIR